MGGQAGKGSAWKARLTRGAAQYPCHGKKVVDGNGRGKWFDTRHLVALAAANWVSTTRTPTIRRDTFRRPDTGGRWKLPIPGYHLAAFVLLIDQ